MRRLAPIILLAVLCALVPGLASASAATTTYDLTSTDSSTVLNTVQAAATVNSTENIVVVKVKGAYPRTVTFVSTTDWIYRSSSGGTDFKVAANQPLTLRITVTTTFYHVRQSADGTLTPLVLE